MYSMLLYTVHHMYRTAWSNIVATSHVWLLAFEMWKVYLRNKIFYLSNSMWLEAALEDSTDIEHFHCLRKFCWTVLF